MKNNQQHQQAPSWRFHIIGLFIIAFFGSLIISFIAIGIMNNLPRSGQGEYVMVSKELCLLGIFFLHMIVPGSLSFMLLRHSISRLYFIIWLIMSCMIIYWLLGGWIAFDKAWRRGL